MRRLTRSDLDRPDEDGAERQGGYDGHAPGHHHHDVVVEPHTGRAALHGAEEQEERRRGGDRELLVKAVVTSG